ncbi:GNAT family N-acetyltransferase [Actinotalea sp. K2]|uniref:GNAT family N-acetyltransferase n=1 Tax=Actinotalea sp. K2 TaxID=2939438 RepID=UPI002017FB19|nr:GNAT family N-acetyltransferase [Actinotalea sp. K2]MCL3863270.1 GNAT family N-acetyltransferase [Actinotalea sp. K2]
MDTERTARPLALPGGLVLRGAGPADLEQIGALLVARGEPVDALDHELVVRDPDAGWSSCAVVVDGDRVVSTATLLDEELRLGEVRLPAGQVELVATDEEYEGRGLVRVLMGWAHDLSAARGHELQVMIGIPYFYRLFGYEYAVEMAQTPRVRRDAGSGTGVRAGTAVAHEPPRLRRAVEADIPATTALQEAAQQGFDVAVPHSPPRRRWLLAHDGSTTWVVERDGRVVATGRTTPPDGGLLLADAAAADTEAAHELLRGVAALAPEDDVRVVDRVGTVTGDAWAGLLDGHREQSEQYYVRLPDAARVLDLLRPVLWRRLVDAGLDRTGREIVVSTYGAHHRIPVGPEGLGPVTSGGPMQDPGDHGGAGVAPDHLGALLFGDQGIEGLTSRRPDVYPGPDRELFATLFPPLTADVLSYYLPF